MNITYRDSVKHIPVKNFTTHPLNTVIREIFVFKNIYVFKNFHNLQTFDQHAITYYVLKILRVFNFRSLRRLQKSFNNENFPNYGT